MKLNTTLGALGAFLLATLIAFILNADSQKIAHAQGIEKTYAENGIENGQKPSARPTMKGPCWHGS